MTGKILVKENTSQNVIIIIIMLDSTSFNKINKSNISATNIVSVKTNMASILIGKEWTINLFIRF